MQVLHRETTLGNNSNIKLGFLRNFWIGKLSNFKAKDSQRILFSRRIKSFVVRFDWCFKLFGANGFVFSLIEKNFLFYLRGSGFAKIP
jgi:hypothetical protein